MNEIGNFAVELLMSTHLRNLMAKHALSSTKFSFFFQIFHFLGPVVMTLALAPSGAIGRQAGHKTPRHASGRGGVLSSRQGRGRGGARRARATPRLAWRAFFMPVQRWKFGQAQICCRLSRIDYLTTTCRLRKLTKQVDALLRGNAL